MLPEGLDGALPEIAIPVDQQPGGLPGPDHQRAVGPLQRHPVRKMGGDPERPVLIVEVGPLEERAGMDHHSVEAARLQRRIVTLTKLGDVVGVRRPGGGVLWRSGAHRAPV